MQTVTVTAAYANIHVPPKVANTRFFRGDTVEIDDAQAARLIEAGIVEPVSGKTVTGAEDVAEVEDRDPSTDEISNRDPKPRRGRGRPRKDV